MVEKFNKKKCCKPSSKNKEAVKSSIVGASKKDAIATCVVQPAYRIAIKDQNPVEKMLSFNEIFPKIDIHNVPVTCKKKDTPVLLTATNKQILPDNIVAKISE